MALSVDEYWEALDIVEELRASNEIDHAEYLARRRGLEEGLAQAARPPLERMRNWVFFGVGVIVGVSVTSLVLVLGGVLRAALR